MKNFTLNRKSLLGSDFLNLIWTSLNSVTSAILTFIFTPLFLAAFGLEDYAYINIWITVNVVLLVFDLGINLTINNIIASEENSATDKQNYFLHYDSVITRRIFFVTCVFLMVILINHFWISQSSEKVLWVIILISLSSTLQFLIQYFYNVYLGLFLHKKVSQANILFLIIRFGLGYVFAILFADVILFFVMQLVISIVQYGFYKWRILNRLSLSFRSKSQLDKLKIQNKKRYILQITILSFASITLAHLDRLWAFTESDLSSYSIYAIAFSGASILQLVIQPLYKTYFSRYSQLKNSSEEKKIKCLSASLIIASSLLTVLSISVFLYAETLLVVWLNESYSNDILYHFKLAVIGLTLAGYFWLPAAYMQANGKPELHNKVIIASIVLGTIFYLVNKQYALELSPAVIWVGHGALLVIIEGYYFAKNILLNESYKVLLYGLLLPLVFVCGLYLGLIQIDVLHDFIGFMLIIFTVLVIFAFIFYKKKILQNAFQ